MKRLILATATVMVAFGSPGATTIHVPGDYDTIGEGLAAASPGDSVLVGPGEYAENLGLPSGVTLISSHGPSETVVRGGVYIGSSSVGGVVSGFTIMGAPGIGVKIYFGHAEISGNLIVDNPSYGIKVYGDGAYSPSILGNTIVDNGLYGIWIDDKYGTMARNIIVGHQDYGIWGSDFAGSSWLIDCNDAWGNGENYHIFGAYPEFGNISEDPLFCDPGSGNYYLAVNSPCVSTPGCDVMGAFGIDCQPPTGIADSPEPWANIKALFR